jgi:antitoxin (DNA-binding transcriptional repressor) of toxin-antitoxin stability system
MATIVNVHEAKTHLSRLLEQVAQGKEVVIARSGAGCAPGADPPAGAQEARIGEGQAGKRLL